MGIRSGDVDPGLFGYLAGQAGLTVGELTQALNSASGLAGLSGVGNDMRAVEAAAAGGRISPDGPVLALVVPTDEELIIARDTAQLIAGG